MAGMLQIITYLLAFYLVIKGFEILMIALASARERRTLLIFLALITLIACLAGAILFVYLQDQQALSLSR